MVGIGIEVVCLLSRLPALFPYESAEESSELMSLLGNIWVIRKTMQERHGNAYKIVGVLSFSWDRTRR